MDKKVHELLFIQKYGDIMTQNIGSAVLCSTRSKQTGRGLRLNSAGVEHQLPLPSQFLYLLLLARKQPFLAKKYVSRKRFRFMEIKRDTAKIAVYPGQARLERVFAKFISELMWQQISPEPSAIKFDDNYLKLIVWNSALDKTSYCLQTSETAYLGDISVYIKLYIKNCLSSEVIF